MSTENEGKSEGTQVPPAPSAPPVPVESPSASPQAAAPGAGSGVVGSPAPALLEEPAASADPVVPREP
ncbi:protease, partial [Streptomyces sp. MBT97]|nr:protease [Streptomyces sp. MBT97]